MIYDNPAELLGVSLGVKNCLKPPTTTTMTYQRYLISNFTSKFWRPFFSAYSSNPFLPLVPPFFISYFSKLSQEKQLNVGIVFFSPSHFPAVTPLRIAPPHLRCTYSSNFSSFYPRFFPFISFLRFLY